MNVDRVRRLLGRAELAWLVERVRTRLERGQPLSGIVALNAASPAQRAAADQLLGRRPTNGSSLTIPLTTVDSMLRSSGAAPDGLAAAVVALTGPIVVRAERAAESDRAWQHAYGPLDALIHRRPELADWYTGVRSSGLTRRLAGDPESGRRLFATLAGVLAEVPTSGETLGAFAARTTGGAHGLDDGSPVATLALGAACALSGHPRGTGASWRREAWASVGIALNAVSSTVLTLGLRCNVDTATGRALAAWSAAGQPTVLTLRQLTIDPPKLELAGQIVSVCENPVVVSTAADCLGADSAALVCTSGQPGAAAMRLLELLVDQDATLRYHGDFDWSGIRIGNTLFGRVPLAPWRFGAPDYRAAPNTGARLPDERVEAAWDSALAPAMSEIGRQVEEELVLPQLVEDLRSPA